MLEPRDLLVHLREWLKGHCEAHTRYFPESDKSGHPHGYDAVCIPTWDVLQRLDEIQATLDPPAGAAGSTEGDAE